MYFSECPEGCFVIEEAGKILAVSFSHVWGKTGWIGPLAVAPEKHLSGLGKEIANESVGFLKRAGCKTIGLETSPRSYRNLGFYRKLGFQPTTLTLDMMRPVHLLHDSRLSEAYSLIRYSECAGEEREEFQRKTLALTQLVSPHLDYTPLIQAIRTFAWGDSLLMQSGEKVIAYTTVQTEPISSEEQSNVLRTLALLVHPSLSDQNMKDVLRVLENFARENFFGNLLIRVPTHCDHAFNMLLSECFQVVHSDLRMTMQGYAEVLHEDGINLSRWE